MSGKTQEKEDTLLRNSHLTALTLKSADKIIRGIRQLVLAIGALATIQLAHFERRAC
jgi:hypothetical protein